ncbi:thioredoxin family protein [Pseudomonas bohemica]|uniref:thioredoxin family protein n=1 Tax=Pseudomonas bohemica TaxID=2044872 RepID=UPI000DA62A93|nr:thioredoxin family protein [Pseudomonas bohemica]
MSHSVITVSEDSLNEYLTGSEQILLDLWAPWCAPCRAMTPTLERLAEEVGEHLTVLKIDVDVFPAVRERFAVRGIPTLILLKGSHELARLSGAQSLVRLREWLGGSGAALPANPAAGRAVQAWGAFYGDTQLREFLVTRLKQQAENGDVKAARAPFWVDGQGTLCAALVHSESLQVFERLSGLPIHLAPALDFVNACEEHQVASLFDGLRVDADVCQVPARLLRYWLSDPLHDWTALLAEPELDALRLQWISLCDQTLAGQAVAASVWATLRSASQALCNPQQDPYRELPGMLAQLLANLSPLPAIEDAQAWSELFAIAGRCNFHLLMSAFGWSDQERAMPGLRNHWFETHERALGGFSGEQLEAHRQRWQAENAGFMAKEQAFHANYGENSKLAQQRYVSVLADLLANAPLYLPA